MSILEVSRIRCQWENQPLSGKYIFFFISINVEFSIEMSTDLCFGMALLEQSNSPVDHMEGLKLVEKSIAQAISIWGNAVEIPLVVYHLRACLAAKDYTNGLAIVDSMFKRAEFTGLIANYGSSDIIRFKAEFLFLKMESEGNLSLSEDIGKLFETSIEIAEQLGLLLIKLKAIIGGLKFWKRMNNVEIIQTMRFKLLEVYQVILASSKKRKIALLEEAERLLKE
jgi:hypothetical protein